MLRHLCKIFGSNITRYTVYIYTYLANPKNTLQFQIECQQIQAKHPHPYVSAINIYIISNGLEYHT